MTGDRTKASDTIGYNSYIWFFIFPQAIQKRLYEEKPEQNGKNAIDKGN
jgi:hypothetical protein